MATRSLYDLFDSRRALLEAVYDEILDEIREQLVAALHAPADDLVRYIRDGVAAFLGPLLEDERNGRIVLLVPRAGHRRRLLVDRRTEPLELLAAGTSTR